MRARSRVSNWRRGGRARKSRKRRRRIILPDVAANPGSTGLIIGGWLSVAAALLHIACIFGGPDWYRFFGAGEGMARAAARGDLRPTLITLAIGAILLVWAAYAFSGAGTLPRLPLLRTALIVITALYLIRGQIGRASCREGVCQYVLISVGDGSLK